jgi:TatD DNase family protein
VKPETRNVFIDSHCHLEGPKFDADRAEALQRAADAGIVALLAIGNADNPESFDCGIRVAEEFDSANSNSPDLSSRAERGICSSPASATKSAPSIYTTVGIHPHEAKIADDNACAELVRLARHPKVIAWGEIGLDYWYDFSPREVQRAVFVRQMELARAAKKPIIIHCRPSKESQDAWDDTIRLLRLNWAGTGLGGILHCFGGTLDQMRAGLDMGFMISFAGNITFPKAEPIREAARAVPLDRMLIETDSPYLAPVPHRGRRNEPAYVVEVAHRIGNLRNMLTEKVGAVTAENFCRFFGL